MNNKVDSYDGPLLCGCEELRSDLPPPPKRVREPLLSLKSSKSTDRRPCP